ARLHTRFYPRFDIETARQLADRMAVDWKKSFGKLSQGNKRKAAVVLALASRADLLVMDEPAAGLDPIARRELYDVLIERMGSGGETTVLLSTHLVADLERLADRVAIIDGGRTLREGNVTAFTEELVRVQVIFPSDVPVGFAIPGARETTHEGAVALGIVDLAQAGDGLMELEHSSELRVTRFPLHLEDAFVELAGEPATSIQEISS
ncbi:MAG: ABC-2 type transport system ATP-binding protein, partial [Planctomycetota bacterium]